MEIAKLYLFITFNLFLNNGGLAGNDLVYILMSVSSRPLFPKVSNSMFLIERTFSGGSVSQKACGENGIDALKSV